MLEYQCPRCRNRAIPYWPRMQFSWRRYYLGLDAVGQFVCSACGTEVTPSLRSFLCTIPICAAQLLVLIFFFPTLIFWLAEIALAIGGTLVDQRFLVWIEKRPTTSGIGPWGPWELE